MFRPGGIGAIATRASLAPGFWNTGVSTGTWSVSTKQITLSATGFSSIRYERPITSGKVYWEISPTTYGANTSFIGGIVNESWTPSASAGLGVSANAWGVQGSSGNTYHNNSSAALLSPLSATDTLMVHFDYATKKLHFGRNGTWSGDPAAGTGQAFTLTGSTFYPGLYRYNSGDQSIIRTASGEFSYSIPSGSAALET